jgi:hypothetical protein
MTAENVKKFVLDYTKGVDLIDCVNYALANGFVEPEDYSDYGCRIEFITKANSSVQDEDGLKEWFVNHHNKFVKKKMNHGDSLEFSFPPMFNFVSEDELSINSIDENSAEVEVANDNGTYLLKIEKGGDNEYGLIVSSLHFMMRWGSGYSPIFE